MTANAEKKPTMERALKWVAALTAIISLIFAVQKLMQAVADNSDRSRRIEELTQVAQRQQQSGDYALAWDSLQSATQVADSGGTLSRMFGDVDADTKKIRIAREDVAMAWLDNISVPSGTGFSSVVERLLPVLETGALASSGSRKGDLLAHIGYGYFLRGRDGHTRIDPIPRYQEAVVADANNPFANAYWAHWILWNGGSFEAANERFAAALQSGREHDRVRGLQLSAYRNRGSDGDLAYLGTVIAMLKNKESVEKAAQKLALWHLSRACSPSGKDLLESMQKEYPKSDLGFGYQAMVEPAKDEAERTRQTKCLNALTA